MKFLIRILCLASLVAGLNLAAQTPPTSDDFSTDMRWQVITNPFLPKGNATTTITDGQMNFVVSPTGSTDDAAGRFWVPSVAPSDTDWNIDVYVNLGTLDLSTPGQYANLNLGVSFANYTMMVAIDRYNNGSGIVYAFDSYNTSTPLVGAYEDTSDSLTTGTLRLAYTAASGGTLTAQFSNGLVSGGAYQTVGTLNNVSGTWGMSASDTFNIILVGGSGNDTGTGPTISSGTAFFDAFASSGLEARPAPVPEPSTYAAIIGLLALGFALYRRRG